MRHRLRRPKFLAGASAALAALAAAPSARADPLTTNDYQIDLFQGPLLLPIRATSLGGAYAGYGEDIPGIVSNAAAPAVREAHAFRHVEVDFSGSFSIPLDLFENNDFDNSGDIDADYSDFVYATAGTMIQVGPLGMGVLGDVQTYSITSATGDETAVVVGRWHALLAASFFEGQLNLGGGVRAVSMGFDPVGENFFFAGAGPQFGVLLRPNTIPFRFGATLRLPVFAAPVGSSRPKGDGLATAGNLVLPDRVVQPWELELGIAVQVGSRPLNLPFIDPEHEDDWAESRVADARAERQRERERLLAAEQDPGKHLALAAELDRREADLASQEDAWLEREEERIIGRHDDAYAELPRQRLLVLMSLVTTGPTDRGVSFERFLAQNEPGSPGKIIGSSGAGANFSPRFGIEAEPIDNRLVIRAGSYYEPSRFGRVGRQHFTFGSQLKLFTTDLFGLLPELAYGIEASVDLAPRYESISATIAVFR